MAKETKYNPRTDFGEGEVGSELRLRIVRIPLYHKTKSVLGVKNLSRLRWEHLVICLQ